MARDGSGKAGVNAGAHHDPAAARPPKAPPNVPTPSAKDASDQTHEARTCTSIRDACAKDATYRPPDDHAPDQHGIECDRPPPLGSASFLAKCTTVRDREKLISRIPRSKLAPAVYAAAADDDWHLPSQIEEWQDQAEACFIFSLKHDSRDSRALAVIGGPFGDRLSGCPNETCQEFLESPLCTACIEQHKDCRTMAAAYAFATKSAKGETQISFLHVPAFDGKDSKEMLGLTGANALTRFNLPITKLRKALAITSIKALHGLLNLILVYIPANERDLFLELLDAPSESELHNAAAPDKDFAFETAEEAGANLFLRSDPPPGYTEDPRKFFKAVLPKISPSPRTVAFPPWTCATIHSPTPPQNQPRAPTCMPSPVTPPSNSGHGTRCRTPLSWLTHANSKKRHACIPSMHRLLTPW